MRQKVNLVRHIFVLFATIFVFALGIFIGNSVETLRVQSFYTQLHEQDLLFQNVNTQMDYINYLVDSKQDGEDISCNLIKNSYFKSTQDLDSAGSKLNTYIELASENTLEFSRLKQLYSNLQFKYWILAKQLNVVCENDFPQTILYFYLDKEDCPACEDQAVHLDYVKKKLQEDILIFSFDANFPGPINLLGQHQGIYDREFPVLILDDEILPFSTNQRLLELVCKNDENKSFC